MSINYLIGKMVLCKVYPGIPQIYPGIHSEPGENAWKNRFTGFSPGLWHNPALYRERYTAV